MKKILLLCILLSLTVHGVKAQLQLIDSNGKVMDNSSSVTFTEPMVKAVVDGRTVVRKIVVR